MRMEAFYMHSIFMNVTSFISFLRIHSSVLPLQVGSIGFWVHVLLQVVTEVHQDLVISPSASTGCRKQKKQRSSINSINSYLVSYIFLLQLRENVELFRDYDKGMNRTDNKKKEEKKADYAASAIMFYKLKCYCNHATLLCNRVKWITYCSTVRNYKL